MMGLAATGVKKAREKSCNLVAQIFFHATKLQQDNKHSLGAVSQTQPTHKRKSMGKFVCIGCRREFLKAHGLKIHLAKTDCGSFYDELANYNKDSRKMMMMTSKAAGLSVQKTATCQLTQLRKKSCPEAKKIKHKRPCWPQKQQKKQHHQKRTKTIEALKMVAVVASFVLKRCMLLLRI